MSEQRIGTTVAGYRIESLLGRGGMSVVYLAEHLALGRKVALKVLAADLAADERFRERFVRESRLAASLEHPNIIPIYEAGEADGQLFIAMRLVRGTDLKALLVREGRLDPEHAVSILSQVARALDAAHAEGLVHRDVKPGNILIAPAAGPGSAEHVYLSDFGLTKRTTSESGITATGQFVGTLDYAAPEQFEGKRLDGRTDVYSLGCVLFECVTGEIPYQRDREAALMYAHLMAPVPRATDVHPGVPPGLDEVITRAMAKLPADRFQTAGEMASEARAVTGVASEDRPGAVAVPAPSGQEVTAAEISAGSSRVVPTEAHRHTATPPTGPVAGPPRGRRLGFLMGVGAAVVAAVVVLVALLNGGGSSPPAAGPTTGAAPASLVDYVVRVDTSTGRVGEPIRVGKDPVSVAISEGSAWVANNGENTVSRVDPVTGKVTATIEVGGGPFAVVAGEGAVWVGSNRRATISRIEPATNEVTDVDVGVAPESMAVGEGAVWIAYDRGFDVDGVVIQKFDAATGRFVGEVVVPGEDIRIFAGTQPWAMVALGDSLWAGGFSGRLFRIDGQSLQIVDQIALSGAPIVSIWAQGDSVWVGANGTPGTVFRVDPGSNEVASTIPAGGGNILLVNQPMSGAADDRDVWVTDTVNGTVSRIVVLSGQAASPVEVGKVPTGLALGLGSVWVTVDG